jgi:hypothetical protein
MAEVFIHDNYVSAQWPTKTIVVVVVIALMTIADAVVWRWRR